LTYRESSYTAFMQQASSRRLRLKADGRIVEVLPDGRERDLPADDPPPLPATSSAPVPSAAVAAGARAAAAPGFAGSPRPPRDRAAMAAASRPVSEPDAAYARRVRAATRLTQAEFAARLGVPIETVRNWEQGKRSPRGPARALLKLVDEAPELAFAVLAGGRGRS
jgi:putative transcriptional regulator